MLEDRTTRTRAIAAGVAAAIVIDALWVRAPFLAIPAVPFAIGAWRYRAAHTVSSAVFALAGLGWALLALNYAMSNGIHAPAEPDQVGHPLIEVGDFLGVYVGGALAAWLAVRLIGDVVRRTRHATGPAVA